MTSFDCYWHWLFINLSIIFQDFKQPVDADHSGWSLDLLGVTVLWLHVPPIRLASHSDSNSPSTGTETADKWWELFADAWETREAIWWSLLYFTCTWSKTDSHYFEASVTNALRFPSMWNHCIPWSLSVGNCVIICWQEFWNMCTTDDGNWRPTGGNWVLSKCRSTTSRITTIITWRNWSGVE